MHGPEQDHRTDELQALTRQCSPAVLDGTGGLWAFQGQVCYSDEEEVWLEITADKGPFSGLSPPQQ